MPSAGFRAIMLEHLRRLRANRRLRYAPSPILTVALVQPIVQKQQDMEMCNPCPPTFLLPISPAGRTSACDHACVGYSSKPSQRVNTSRGSRGMLNWLTAACLSA